MNSNVSEQIKSAYREMASKALYRPSAPSDGLGNISIPKEQLNLAREAEQYAAQWWKAEDDCIFFIGCCDFGSRRATIYAIEAARNMCGGSSGNPYALKLLKMAVKELERVLAEEKTR
jgi:hypothetical protein